MTIEKPQLLIVDDSPSNIQVLAQMLSDDYCIKVATDGARCLELAVADPSPDLILLDVDMPGMSGYEVCQQLKAQDKTSAIPVIFITGMVRTEDEVYGFELGAIDYITKPFHPVIVEARIKTHITIKRQSDELKRMAMRDQLTNLYNRHYLMDAASKKMARAKRHSFPLSMIVIDIDLFKNINDKYGHMVGDAVLRDIASLLDGSCRKEDFVARFGGEEFVFILDHCDLADCLNKAEVIRCAVETLNPQGIAVTVSLGVTVLQPDDTDFDCFFNRADAAVYAAKADGRNCVSSSSMDYNPPLLPV
ncbi:MAG: diguanylate cyclase [Pseudomonadales bacterium]